MNWATLLTPLAVLSASAYGVVKIRKRKQLAFIRDYHFPSSIRKKICKKYPHLDEEQSHLVFRALREYFWMCNIAKKNMIAMPSQVVDDAWHEFILHTRLYKKFCQQALGRFLHHTPTEAMNTPTVAQEGIRRAWRLACAREKINPKHPEQLPLIFAIDAMLNIPDGFTYVLNCTDPSGKTKSPASDGYCAGHIGCAAGCAGDSGSSADSSFFDGLFDGDSGSGCSGGCGGGCGGD